jgi:hypothetical protein
LWSSKEAKETSKKQLSQSARVGKKTAPKTEKAQKREKSESDVGPHGLKKHLNQI